MATPKIPEWEQIANRVGWPPSRSSAAARTPQALTQLDGEVDRMLAKRHFLLRARAERSGAVSGRRRVPAGHLRREARARPRVHQPRRSRSSVCSSSSPSWPALRSLQRLRHLRDRRPRRHAVVVGVANFVTLLHRTVFWKALANTFYFVLVGGPLSVAARSGRRCWSTPVWRGSRVCSAPSTSPPS